MKLEINQPVSRSFNSIVCAAIWTTSNKNQVRIVQGFVLTGRNNHMNTCKKNLKEGD